MTVASPAYPLRVGGTQIDSLDAMHATIIRYDAYDAQAQSLAHNPVATEAMMAAIGGYVSEALADLYLATGGHVQCSMFLANGQCYSDGSTLYVSHDIYEKVVLERMLKHERKGKVLVESKKV